MGCDELVPGSAWLQSLNGPNAEKEAPGPTRVLTIYDGTGADILYLPWLLGWPVRDQDSPALKGAQNVKMPGLTHDELRTNDDAVSAYLRFVNELLTPWHTTCNRPQRARGTLCGTGQSC